MNWRRELILRETREIETLRGTAEWSQAMTDLCFQESDLRESTHNVRMVAARAKQLMGDDRG